MPALQALVAALLFGLSAPLAKLLLEGVSPVRLAGLLYLGAGLLLTVVGLVRPGPARRPWTWRERGLVAAAVGAGGLAAPPLLLWGLARSPASVAALLLNLEVVLSVLLAGTLFGERLGIRVLGAAGLMAAGGIALSLGPGPLDATLPALAIAGACLLWALDTNLTGLVADLGAVRLAQIKGLVAGGASTVLATLAGEGLPPARATLLGLALGAVSYGISLALFIDAMRGLGAARAAAYFALAPFLGAVASVALLGEPLSAALLVGAVLMGAGAAVLGRERHGHWHVHEPGVHVHRHVHDVHHQHAHDGGEGPEPHAHPHATGPLEHEHPHTPDAHHDHDHP
jgi:drug/metabolite transporter (DMT)-like permease